jgi:hypothetical protein
MAEVTRKKKLPLLTLRRWCTVAGKVAQDCGLKPTVPRSGSGQRDHAVLFCFSAASALPHEDCRR